MHVALQQVEQAPLRSNAITIGGPTPVACLDPEHDVSLYLDLRTKALDPEYARERTDGWKGGLGRLRSELRKPRSERGPV
jgi:hypothetical protein